MAFQTSTINDVLLQKKKNDILGLILINMATCSTPKENRKSFTILLTPEEWWCIFVSNDNDLSGYNLSTYTYKGSPVSKSAKRIATMRLSVKNVAKIFGEAAVVFFNNGNSHVMDFESGMRLNLRMIHISSFRTSTMKEMYANNKKQNGTYQIRPSFLATEYSAPIVEKETKKWSFISLTASFSIYKRGTEYGINKLRLLRSMLQPEDSVDDSKYYDADVVGNSNNFTTSSNNIDDSDNDDVDVDNNLVDKSISSIKPISSDPKLINPKKFTWNFDSDVIPKVSNSYTFVDDDDDNNNNNSNNNNNNNNNNYYYNNHNVDVDVDDTSDEFGYGSDLDFMANALKQANKRVIIPPSVTSNGKQEAEEELDPVSGAGSEEVVAQIAADYELALSIQASRPKSKPLNNNNARPESTIILDDDDGDDGSTNYTVIANNNKISNYTGHKRKRELHGKTTEKTETVPESVAIKRRRLLSTPSKQMQQQGKATPKGSSKRKAKMRKRFLD